VFGVEADYLHAAFDEMDTPGPSFEAVMSSVTSSVRTGPDHPLNRSPERRQLS
jgi:hypothetical protein